MKLLLFFLFLLPATTFSQDKVLKLMDTVIERQYYTYDTQARYYFFKFPDSTFYYGKKCEAMANKNNNLWGIINAKILIGYSYYLRGNYSESIATFLTSLKLTEDTKDNTLKKYSLLEIYDGLGCTYCEADFFEIGLPYLVKSLNAAYQLKDTGGVVSEMASLGPYYQKNNQLDSAEVYLKAALSLTDKINYTYTFKPGLLCSMGNCQLQRGNITAALQYWKETTESSYTDDLAASEAYQKMGKYYSDKKKYDTAYIYLKKAAELGNKTNNIEKIFRANEGLLDLFKETNATDSINHYLAICYDLKDSVSRKEKTKELQSFYIDEELRQQNITATRLKYKNTVTLLVSCSVIAGLILLTVFQFRNVRQKQKAKTQIENAYTELHGTQAQLIQSEKMASLGELTAGIAHEIQNPLNFVNNFSEVNTELIDELTNELTTGNNEEALLIAKDIKENEEKINHHGKRADLIVKGMLQHSRTSTGQKELTDINALADEYLRLSYHGLRAKDQTFNAGIKTDFDISIKKININPQDIGRVLLNLFTNAFYAVNEKAKQSPYGYKPKITVSTKNSAISSLENGRREVILAVKDNGNGIPKNIIDKIFQPFFTTKPTGQGTGLGLSLSYDIIKAHGGEIKVATKEGEYSEFIIHLIA